MKDALGPRDAQRLAAMTDEELRQFLSKCRPQEALALDAQFEMWAARGQMAPAAEGWRVWLMLAGRGFGKTRAGAEWINGLALTGARRIALAGASIEEARKVMVEGPSGILAVARRQRNRIKWEPSLGRITWQTGSIAQLFSGDHADGLRGPEHHFAWGVSHPRLGGRSSGRRCARQHPARKPGEWRLLHRRDKSDGRVRRAPASVGRLWRRGMALHRRERGANGVRQEQRAIRDFRWRIMGGRPNQGRDADDRRRPSGWAAAGGNRRPSGWDDC